MRSIPGRTAVPSLERAERATRNEGGRPGRWLCCEARERERERGRARRGAAETGGGRGSSGAAIEGRREGGRERERERARSGELFEAATGIAYFGLLPTLALPKRRRLGEETSETGESNPRFRARGRREAKRLHETKSLRGEQGKVEREKRA
ncbi:hypothetical protein Mp_1g16940 [Marchantia polymorpha subsp. ruderalis]|uniref:Uncharacterized protein n=2 Tax=Marchantia polymorpha TaxID=3197 RepID=A0AAF6AR12_MARPO|nr:hypothetical protein MARPO_0001s0034 [Marchantia polymorpha]BBM98882.1 hypothetical protein Mp_1g16940 [Marchantia polymorpha subsp. ruderalis]|eukprot:PTQ49958.1 hypothetical protein MARPO_0001s0034 [Marchantia polymorpha]